MKLSQLIKTPYDVEINGMSADSRKVRPGYLFGTPNGQVQYIENAIANGAVAVIAPKDYACDNKKAIFIKTANPNHDFAIAAAKFYGQQPEHICAITGTNGKTSIADFVRQLLTMMNFKAASMGTLGLIKGNDAPIPSPNTTPDAVSVCQELVELAKEGYRYVAMEASSHGLEQARIGGVKVKVAGFTNLTRDHLDYHKTMENYLAAKMILFTDNLVENGVAILNADIEEFKELKNICLKTHKKVMAYGHKGDKIKLIKVTPLINGQKLELEFYGKMKEIEIPLAGEFQAMNVLCALGMASELTGKPEEVITHIANIKGAKGRVELVGEKNGAAIFVDYAHTPDALENVIKAMRPHTANKLHVVFGCGGDRDAGKRPIMGQIANDLADVIYVTDDNPRTENAENIRTAIMKTCKKAKNIGDRALAIKTAMSKLQAGDILIIAGKGHESGQYINGQVLPFSDQSEILKNL